ASRAMPQPLMPPPMTKTSCIGDASTGSLPRFRIALRAIITKPYGDYFELRTNVKRNPDKERESAETPVTEPGSRQERRPFECRQSAHGKAGCGSRLMPSGESRKRRATCGRESRGTISAPRF